MVNSTLKMVICGVVYYCFNHINGDVRRYCMGYQIPGYIMVGNPPRMVSHNHF